ncbi:MAG: ABC transporter ATP-binding protein [Corynebacterium sp.]|nr:ABC transporter ATP-binding protein [Corynebacterium sp.]
MIPFLNLYSKILGQRNDLPALGVWYTIASLIQVSALLMVHPLLTEVFDQNLANAALWFVGILLVSAMSLVMIPIGWWSLSVCSRDLEAVRKRVGQKVIRLPLGWFDSMSAAHVSNAVGTCCDDISHIASVILPNFVQCVVVPLGVSVGMLMIDWRIALVLLLAVPVLWWVTMVVDKRTAKTAGFERWTSAELADHVIEFAKLQPVLRAVGNDRGLERVNAALKLDLGGTLWSMREKGQPLGTFALIVGVAVIGALTVAGYLWIEGDIDAATFFTAALLLTLIYQPAIVIPLYKSEFVATLESLRRIDEILSVDPLPEVSEEKAKLPASNDVRIADVSFGYRSGEMVLRDVDIRIPERSVTALVGPSGCGKSTLLRLVARFWDVDSGQIQIGGVDVRDMPTAEVMKRISMVMQDTYLFDSTVEDNIRLGKPDATNEELAEAIRRARLVDVLDRLPHGAATQVGEGGRRLSGGERQRVAIARALLKDAPILLLDEVTSSLDGANEAAVTRAIRELAQGRTVVMIAHRLSTVTRADQIVVLNSDGRVDDIGTHETLRQRSGIYSEFLEAQAAGAAWRVAGS